MGTTFLITKNNAISTLDANINDSVTSLDVVSGDGTLFPSTFPFHITLDDEIIEVAARSTDTLSSLIRAQQGTSAASHTAGAAVELRITAKHFDDITEIFTNNEMVTYEDTIVSHEGNTIFN